MKTAVRVLAVLAAVFCSATFAATTRYYPSQASAKAAGDAQWGPGEYTGGVAVDPVPPIEYWGLHYWPYVPELGRRESYIYAYPINGTACPVGQSIDSATGQCFAPPPPVDCGAKAGQQTVGQNTGPALPNGGICVKTFDMVGPPPYSADTPIAEGGCEVVMVINISSGSGTSQSNSFGYKYTGNSCDANAASYVEPTVTPETPKLPDKQCVTGSDGSTACVDARSTPNCGTFNGDKVCVDKVPAGNCAYLPGGSWACGSAATSPPKPTASPSVTMSGRGSNGAPAQVLIYPPGAAGGDAQSQYGGAGAPGQDGAGCGGEGQPKCKIDEEGTPTFDEGSLDGAEGALDGALTGAEGAAGEGPYGDGSGVASGARGGVAGALPSPGDCGPITFALPFGNEVVIDLYDKCAPFRAAMAWFLGLVTAWFLLNLAFRAPS